MMGNPFTVSLVSWHDGEPLLRAIREAVFIREQGVPEELEWDGLDEGCRHALALSLQGEAIGCGRLLVNGHGKFVMPDYETCHARSPHLNPLPHAGEEANESLREFYVNGHIGRMAVLPQWREQRVGTAILEALLDDARARGLKQVDVDAQTHAIPFYRHFDFVEQGEVFMDAGLPHIKMTLEL